MAVELQAPIFAALPPAALDHIQRIARPRRYHAGEVMLQEGEQRGELFVLLLGEALVTSLDWHGRRSTLAHLGPGECFGELSMLSGEPASATVEALTDVDALVLDHRTVALISDEYPQLARNLTNLLAERLRLSNERRLQTQRARPALFTALCAPGDAYRLVERIARSVVEHTRHPAALIDFTGSAAALGRNVTPLSDAGALAISRDGPSAGELHLLAGEPEAGRVFVAAIERLQLRLRDLLVLLPPASPVAEHLAPLARTIDIVPDTAPPADGGAATRSSEAVVLSQRTTRPTVGELRAARARFGLPVTAIISSADLDTDAPLGAPARAGLDRLARSIAGIGVGLALGGGGAKGYAHIGVLRVLQRARVPFDFVSGCSIGAPLAAGVAAEWDVDEIRARVDAISQKAVRANLPIVSVLTNRGIRAELQAVVGPTRFEDLPTPCAIVAVDIESGREVLMRSGPVWPALLASMAFPGIYEPVVIGSRRLVDGGVLNPVPVSCAVTLGADLVIGCNLSGSARYDVVKAVPEVSHRQRFIIENIARTLEIMQRKIVQESCARADVTIEPAFEDPPGLLDFKRGRQLEAVGAEAAEASLPRIRELLPWLG